MFWLSNLYASNISTPDTCSKNVFKIHLMGSAHCALLIRLILPVCLIVGCIYTPVALALTSPEGYELTSLTRETAQKAREGLIGYKDGTIDTLIFGKLPLNPDEDPDNDGLTTAQELFTYVQDGKTYLYYASHPMIEDSDGDGFPDKSDKDPLSWNVSPRDAVIFQKLVYRDDDYINKVLDYTYNFMSKDCYEGNAAYKLMHNEMSSYWKLAKSWHLSSGLDAVLFEFSNKHFPFLKDKSVHFIAFRGTQESNDYGDDVRLGLGLWPYQANDVLDIADELDKTRPQNTYMTGHSLGGFLVQIFFVRSVGDPYGDPANNDRHVDLNYHDKDKKSNPEIRQAFTFNAPALSKKGASLWLREYSTLGDTLTRHLNSKHYVTANDTITRLTGAFEGATRLEASQGGHSSSSFFEHKYRDVSGYSVGKRYDLSSFGYHDDLTDLCHFVKPTYIKLVDNTTGDTLENRVYACREQDTPYIKALNLVPANYKVVSQPDQIQYAQTNVFRVEPQSYHLTYVFKMADTEISRVDIAVAYKKDYVAPSVPQHHNEDFEYALADGEMITKLEPQEIVSDRTFEIQLVERPLETTTFCDLVDKDGKVIKTIEFKTKPSQKGPLHIQETDLPQGYEISGENPDITPGSHTRVSISKKQYEIIYRYMNGQAEIKKETERVEYDAQSTYELRVPEGFIVKEGYAFKQPTHVTENRTLEIPIVPKPAEAHTVTLVFTKNADGRITEVARRVVSVKHGERLPAQEAPVHERASEGYSYSIAPETNYQDEVMADKIVEIPLIEYAPAQPTPPQVYNVIVSYVYNGAEVKRETQQVSEGKSVEINVPTSPKGTYTAQTEGVNLTPHEHTTIVIPLSFKKNDATVILEYVTSEGAVLKSDTVEIPVETVPFITRTLEYNGDTYHVEEGYNPPLVTEDTVIKIPLKREIPFEEQGHLITLELYENGKLIKRVENIRVVDGDYPTIELPEVSDGRDGSYTLEHIPEPVTQSGVVKANLVYEPNVYPVRLIFVHTSDKGETVVKESLEEVTTGQVPRAEMDEIKDTYQIADSFVMPVITHAQEVRIPLELKGDAPAEEDSEVNPGVTPGGGDPTPVPQPGNPDKPGGPDKGLAPVTSLPAKPSDVQASPQNSDGLVAQNGVAPQGSSGHQRVALIPKTGESACAGYAVGAVLLGVLSVFGALMFKKRSA